MPHDTYDEQLADPDAPYRAGVPLSPIRAAALRKRKQRQRAVPAAAARRVKPFWESRTLWINVIGLLLLAAASPEIKEIIPVEARPYIAAAVAFLNIVNRMMSTAVPLTLRRPPPKDREEVEARTA